MTASAKVKLLISLAQIDGTIAEREKSYIMTIGLANGIPPEEMNGLIDRRHEIIVPADLTTEEKFDYLFHLVQLMKIDERMYKEEILFCSTIAEKLGYRREVMFELMLHIKSDTMEAKEKGELESITRKYLAG